MIFTTKRVARYFLPVENQKSISQDSDSLVKEDTFLTTTAPPHFNHETPKPTMDMGAYDGDNIHSMVSMLVDSFPNLKCQTRACESSAGVCMKSPDNANKETCYCKPDFYGDSCENKRALAWGSRNPNGMGFQSDPGVPPNWDKLYQNIFMMSSFTLVALVIAMFMVGYFFGKSTRPMLFSAHNSGNSGGDNNFKKADNNNNHSPNCLATNNGKVAPTTPLIRKKSDINSGFPSACSIYSRLNSRMNSPTNDENKDLLTNFSNKNEDINLKTAILVSGCDDDENTNHNEQRNRATSFPSRPCRQNTLTISTSGYGSKFGSISRMGSCTSLVSPMKENGQRDSNKKQSFRKQKAASLMLDVP